MKDEIRYQAGQHTLQMAGKEGRWTIALDGVSLGQSFYSLADAWTAGVTEAFRLDMQTASTPRGGSPLVQCGA
jgi:hypothetical protein